MEFQKLDDGLRRRWDKARPSVGEQPNVEGIHSLDILRRNDVVDDVALIERSRQGGEKEDAVDTRVRAESFERRDKLSLRRVAGEVDFVDRDIELLPVSREALLVRARRRIDPDGDHRESRSDAPGRECCTALT